MENKCYSAKFMYEFYMHHRFSATFSTFYVADFLPRPIRPSLSQVSDDKTSLGHVERCEFSSTDTYYPVDYFDKRRNEPLVPDPTFMPCAPLCSVCGRNWEC